MINPAFYNKRNTVRKYGSGKVNHFPQRPSALAVETRQYVVNAGDTYYSLATRLFGEERQYLWTIIADINTPRYPDELVAGEVIHLPVVVVQDTFTT